MQNHLEPLRTDTVASDLAKRVFISMGGGGY